MSLYNFEKYVAGILVMLLLLKSLKIINLNCVNVINMITFINMIKILAEINFNKTNVIIYNLFTPSDFTFI